MLFYMAAIFKHFWSILHLSNFLVNTYISNINKSFIEHSFLTACDTTRYFLFYFILLIIFQMLIEIH